MRRISAGLSLVCNNKISSKFSILDTTFKKVKLIRLTMDSMKSEYNIIIQQYPEYAAVCVSWIPVKSYYVIFNLITIFEYLLTGDKKLLTTSHSKILGLFKKLLETKNIAFNISNFNEIKSVAEIEKFQIPKFENLRSGTQYREKQILNKLADYLHDELKRKSKWKRLVKGEMEIFRKSKLGLFEFFYWYRIKVNYRDLEFISSKVSPSEFKQFYEDYYILTTNFYNAFKKCINNLSQIRTGINLL